MRIAVFLCSNMQMYFLRINSSRPFCYVTKNNLVSDMASVGSEKICLHYYIIGDIVPWRGGRNTIQLARLEGQGMLP